MRKAYRSKDSVSNAATEAGKAVAELLVQRGLSFQDAMDALEEAEDFLFSTTKPVIIPLSHGL